MKTFSGMVLNKKSFQKKKRKKKWFSTIIAEVLLGYIFLFSVGSHEYICA